MRISDFNIFLKEEWLPFLNTNLKWGVSLFLRTMFITITIVMILLTIKYTGIVKHIRSMALEDIMGITPKETTVISVPDIDYTSDISDLDKLIQALEGQKTNEEK